jgi:diadenosine tetraphosphate (Ap4A) HIT family hydrolase
MGGRHKHCVFCPKNGKVKIIAETKSAYLIMVIKDGKVLAGCYFIIPKRHIESILGLPKNWQASFTILLEKILEIEGHRQFNVSVNEGEEAGRIVKHCHFWIIIRRSKDEVGKPYKGFGMKKLMELLDELTEELRQSQAPNPRENP